MDWQGGPVSSNIEDRRDGSGGDGGGMVTGIGGGGGGLGIGAIILIFVISYFTGINPQILMGGAQILTGNGGNAGYVQQQQSSSPARTGTPTDQMGKFIAAVLGETEAVWSDVLPAQANVQYTKPKLVLFSGQTSSGCGTAQSAMGPFYCPNDQKVYLDMAFFNEMQSKYGGGGEFAYAYLVAHEIGHHVENLLGILPELQQQQDAAGSKAAANAVSRRIELMADCFAGVWAANANQKWNIIQQGDVEHAIATAQAIGDDTLQKAARGYSVPDSFTHGTSADRQKWLTAGLQTGQIKSCLPLYQGNGN